MRLRHVVLPVICLIGSLALTVPLVADTVVVKPSTLAGSGWVVRTRNGAEASGYEFAAGPATPPAGSGSLHMWVGGDESDPLPKAYAGTNRFSGIRLDKITQFRLSVCPRYWNYSGAQPITVELALSKAGNLRLCTFYPWGFNPSGYYSKMEWREYNLLDPNAAWEITSIDSTNKLGNWAWLLGRCSYATIVTPPASDWPDGTLSGTGISIKIGAGKANEPSHCGGAWWRESSGCNAYVDKLTIGYRDANGQETVTTYDFEAE